MRFSLVYISLLLSVVAFPQYRNFLVHLNQSEGIEYKLLDGTNQRLDLFHLDREEISGFILSSFKDKLNKKLITDFEQDTLLNKICNSAVLNYSSSKFKKRHQWNKEQRIINYALKLQEVKYRRFYSYAFQVDLLDFSPGHKYYFDRKNEDNPLQLYEGEYPKVKDPEHDDYEEPLPIYAKTELQMVDEFFNRIERSRVMNELYSREFSRIGIAVKMDETSLLCKKRPKMSVVLIIAGKQNIGVKKKDRLERLVQMDKSYE
ncbi:hypothetical protein K6119_07385 [Paracrocinitomix mangrovi]|uniref:hypothetical protein n=1 Tax=Paracrocinitomix mangrovi TaxID=2862509 RepID=UPI001C8D22A3|nr:hypothetical protein [Paracrocinitomix mangrovi]UKN03336.1 hypothetical protein K6119_07385 [Paracrocinitomix mangrovi]